MKMGIVVAAGLLAVPLAARADDPPVIEHTPLPCTVPEKAISLCAAISDDNRVATARVYFPRAGEDFYQFVDMAFSCVSYCRTIPRPRQGEIKALGEWSGARRQAHFETGLGPGQATSAHLLFPLAVPRPGVHAPPLLLEYPEGGPADAAGNPPLASQRAYLLLALGGTAEPAVRIDAPEMRLDTRGELRVGLSSIDGAPHRVSLRVLTARGVRTDDPPLEVEVPARGTVTPTVVLMRSGAPRGTRHGILLVAATLDGVLERTSVATSIVEITPDPGLMPALGRPFVALAPLLLAP